MGSVSRLANVNTHREAPWTPLVPGLVPSLDDWFLSASLATVSATTAALRTTSAAGRGNKLLSYFGVDDDVIQEMCLQVWTCASVRDWRS